MKLSQKQLDEIAKGVKNVPNCKFDAIDRGIDATHADINLARFFKNLIIREVAGVTQWDINSDIKPLFIEAERRFDAHMKNTCGINPAMMMPGNYARDLFKEENSSNLLFLLKEDERKTKLKKILAIFRLLRTVYRSNKPKQSVPDLVEMYKTKAVNMGKLLIDYFS
jgi:hypothetical protein